MTVVSPRGRAEVAKYGLGDNWHSPTGHFPTRHFRTGRAPANQSIGGNPCHASLTFNGDLSSGHGAFGLSDWLSRYDATTLSQCFGALLGQFTAMPPEETYIMHGPMIPDDRDTARPTKVFGPSQSHRHGRSSVPSWFRWPGGTTPLASSEEFSPLSDMTGIVTRLQLKATYILHWHPNANEWQYAAKGRVRVTLFAPDKRMAATELSAGVWVHLTAHYGHSVQDIGDTGFELVRALDSGAYQQEPVPAWQAQAPPQLLADNLGIPETSLARFGSERIAVAICG